jgi:hypothetical protein
MKAYRYRDGRNGKIAAADIVRELKKIEKRRGELTPHILIEELAPEEHPLHPILPWNDERSGYLYRLVVARRLIRDVVVVEEGEFGEAVVRNVYVSVVHQDRSRSYVETADVEIVSGEEFDEQQAREAIAALRSWTTRYRDVKLLAKVTRMIDKIIEKFMEPA